MIITSRITGEEYETKDTVRIFNPRQYGLVLKNGGKLIDCGVDARDRFFIVFDKYQIKDLMDKWVRYELT